MYVHTMYMYSVVIMYFFTRGIILLVETTKIHSFYMQCIYIHVHDTNVKYIANIHVVSLNGLWLGVLYELLFHKID